MQAMPLVVWLRPVRSDDRVGEHSAVVCQFVYVNPDAASRLMLGVSINPPHGSIAENPTSSSTMYRTLGAPAGATGWTNGSQSGIESRSSRLIVPLNGFAICVLPLVGATALGADDGNDHAGSNRRHPPDRMRHTLRLRLRAGGAPARIG
jgi:hypothetical protein